MGKWRGGRSRWVLAVLVGCIASLVLTSAAAASITGSISGTVTSACACEDFSPLMGIEVTVYEDNAKQIPVAFATTGAHGEYTVEGLPGGEYKVEFFAGFEINQNFLTQFYKNKSSFAEAEPVKVVIAGPAQSEKIDAEMQPGGEIEGTVTDASTHKVLPNALVVALGPGEAVDDAAITEASGRYVMTALVPGSYRIGFAASGYVTQYYSNQPSFALANLVTASQGITVPGIDAALMPKAPINTVAPVVSGTPAVGQTLSCTTGSWTGTPTPTFTYSWLRDGVAIPGATTDIYPVQALDQGNGLTCKITASNKSGIVAALSNTLIVPVPVAPAPKPVVTLSSSEIVVSGSSARVPVTCANATCAGTLELTEQIVTRHHRGHRTITRRATLILGRGSYALAAGHSATIVVHLTSIGKNVLAKAKHHRLSAKVLASVLGGARVQKSVVLREVIPAKHTGKRR